MGYSIIHSAMIPSIAASSRSKLPIAASATKLGKEGYLVSDEIQR